MSNTLPIAVDAQMALPSALTIMPPAAIDAQARAELDVAVNTAKRYPRDLKRAVAQAISLATFNEDTAASCTYALKRENKRTGRTSVIEGASIRLAEIMASTWGNLTVKTSVVDVGRETITVRASCRDLETNVSQEAEVVRRITDKEGRRFSEDMIVVTTQAASAIARRNAIMMVIPKAFADIVRAQAVEVATGRGEPIERRRQRALDLLKRAYSIDEDRIAAAVGRNSMMEVTVDDLAELQPLHQAVKHGEMKLEDAFPPVDAEATEKPTPEPPKPAKPARAQKVQQKAAEPDPEPVVVHEEAQAVDPGPDEVLEALVAMCEQQDVLDLKEIVVARAMMGETGRSIKAALVEASKANGASNDNYTDRIGHWWGVLPRATKDKLKKEAGL